MSEEDGTNNATTVACDHVPYASSPCTPPHAAANPATPPHGADALRIGTDVGRERDLGGALDWDACKRGERNVVVGGRGWKASAVSRASPTTASAVSLAQAASALQKPAGFEASLGVTALASLALSARVYLRLCLPLPPDLAASLIQVLPPLSIYSASTLVAAHVLGAIDCMCVCVSFGCKRPVRIVCVYVCRLLQAPHASRHLLQQPLSHCDGAGMVARLGCEASGTAAAIACATRVRDRGATPAAPTAGATTVERGGACQEHACGGWGIGRCWRRAQWHQPCKLLARRSSRNAKRARQVTSHRCKCTYAHTLLARWCGG